MLLKIPYRIQANADADRITEHVTGYIVGEITDKASDITCFFTCVCRLAHYTRNSYIYYKCYMQNAGA